MLSEIDYVVRVTCDLDLNQKEFVFYDFMDAKEWVKSQLVEFGSEYTLEELQEEGLIYFNSLNMIAIVEEIDNEKE